MMLEKSLNEPNEMLTLPQDKSFYGINILERGC